jgi:hypothetical protein
MLIIIVSVVMRACSIAAGFFPAPARRHCRPLEKVEGVKRREAPVRIAAPLARLADGPVPCGTTDP